MPLDQDELLHHLINIVGIRAPITAAAVLQLIAELRRAEVLGDSAIERIKQAIAREAFQASSSHLTMSEFEAEIRQQLDRLFEVGKTSSPS